MKILVADDEHTSQLIIRVALLELGHDCQIVSDGIEAWNAFQAEQHDVVISDWKMPGLTGIQLCRKIRAHDAGGHTYLILVTSQVARDQIIEGMSAGADDYLLKPLDLDALQIGLIAATRVTALHGELDHKRIEQEDLNLELMAIARRDPLTGLGNRRALQEDLDLLEARVKRYGHRYCMALFDVDHFKTYNDTYGHQGGDEVLRVVANHLQAQARGGDAVYRFGGEEFLCIFPEQSLETGLVAAHRMRQGLKELAIPHAGNTRGVLTLSAGLAMLDPSHLRPVSEVLKEADDALYRAKQFGRNRVEHLTTQST